MEARFDGALHSEGVDVRRISGEHLAARRLVKVGGGRRVVHGVESLQPLGASLRRFAEGEEVGDVDVSEDGVRRL